MILASVKKKIEQCQNDFLWGKGKEGDGMHLVAWNDICKPKKNGGLGISKVRDVNEALLCKWLWRFVFERDSLWCQVIANKYSLISDWEVETYSLPYGCSCWKATMKTSEEFRSEIRFDLGSISRIRFWKDRWCMDRPLMMELPYSF